MKVGTTGTGGMGLNIPYTHSEDKPSKVLLAKNEAAFGHTGLLFLLARTPNSPIVKEVKPAAMIGYRGVEVRPARDKHGNNDLFTAKRVGVAEGSSLDLAEATGGYETQGKLEVPIVDTGENGVFTAGEFAAITALAAGAVHNQRSRRAPSESPVRIGSWPTAAAITSAAAMWHSKVKRAGTRSWPRCGTQSKKGSTPA